jgi:hypothetical protein
MSQELHTQPISDEASAEVEEHLERYVHSNSSLDTLIGSRLDDDGQPIPPKSVRDFEDFVEARKDRQELKERHGTDAANVLEKLNHYSQDLKQNGALAGEKLAGDYLAMANTARLLHVAAAEKADSEASSTADKPKEDVHRFVKLDREIEKAQNEKEQRERDKLEFEAAQPKIEALRAENPHLTYQEAFKLTVHNDRELLRNPYFALERLVPASGHPVTSLQKVEAQIQTQQQQELGAIGGLMDEMEKRGELLSLERYAPAMAQLWKGELLVNGKHFVKTGDTHRDLQAMNRIVELLELDRLQNLERENAVAKAKRAGPVAVSGGNRTAASSGSGGLDSIIGSATAHLSDD